MARSNHTDFLDSQDTIQGISEAVMMLGPGEVILRKNQSGTLYDVFTIDELTPEQLIMLSRGESPEGLTVFIV